MTGSEHCKPGRKKVLSWKALGGEFVGGLLEQLVKWGHSILLALKGIRFTHLLVFSVNLLTVVAQCNHNRINSLSAEMCCLFHSVSKSINHVFNLSSKPNSRNYLVFSSPLLCVFLFVL